MVEPGCLLWGEALQVGTAGERLSVWARFFLFLLGMMQGQGKT